MISHTQFNMYVVCIAMDAVFENKIRLNSIPVYIVKCDFNLNIFKTVFVHLFTSNLN